MGYAGPDRIWIWPVEAGYELRVTDRQLRFLEDAHCAR